MVVNIKSEVPQVKIHDHEIEKVSKFMYLGELITENGKEIFDLILKN